MICPYESASQISSPKLAETFVTCGGRDGTDGGRDGDGGARGSMDASVSAGARGRRGDGVDAA